MKSFLKPLTAEKEKEYLDRYYLQKDEEARDVLIERNMRLVAHVIKKYSFLEKDMDELLSIGCIGLIKAVNTYDPQKAKTTRLATYAGRCIENEILMHLRMEKKLSKEVSLYEPIGKDKEGNEINLIDIIESESDDIIGRMDMDENLLRLKLYLKSALTPREYDVIQLRFGLNCDRCYTQKEIALKYHISRSYVSRIEKHALQKLRDCFEMKQK